MGSIGIDGEWEGWSAAEEEEGEEEAKEQEADEIGSAAEKAVCRSWLFVELEMHLREPAPHDDVGREGERERNNGNETACVKLRVFLLFTRTASSAKPQARKGDEKGYGAVCYDVSCPPNYRPTL
jgi:hypothetical protein